MNLKDILKENDLFYDLAESIIVDQRFVLNHLNKMRFKKPVTNKEVFRSILESKYYIEKHANQNFCLDHLSKSIGISKYHFIRTFKHIFDLSPYQYQQKFRLLNAKSLLLNGVSIQKSAFETGYADTPSFSKAFKKNFGKAPSEFLK